jgi:hypothetical protein
MNDRLRAALAVVEQLSDGDQALIAAIIDEEIADLLAWKQSFSDPRSQAALDQLEAQLDAQIAAGDVYDWPDSQGTPGSLC